MKSFIIVVLTAATALTAACASKTTAVAPAAAPAAAPSPESMAAPAAGPSRRVNVTYTAPNGFPAAQHLASMYCSQHFGVGTAQLLTDSPPGRATFACPGM